MDSLIHAIRIALHFRWSDIRYCLRRPKATRFMWQIVAIDLRAHDTES
jgi:hypothetical protein